jgi:hypothetical protein
MIRWGDDPGNVHQSSRLSVISQKISIQEALPSDISRQRVEHGEDSVRGYSRFWEVNMMHRPIKK